MDTHAPRTVPSFARGDELQALLAAIVDSSDDAIVSKTLDGVITSWNRGAERLFGYTAAEAVGQQIFLIIPDDRRAEEEDVLARVRRGEKIDDFETVRRTKDGRHVEISLTVSPIKDAQGTIIGASKVARNITERRQLEALRARLAAAHEQSELRLRRMMNIEGVCILLFREDGTLIDANDEFVRVFGYPREQVTSQRLTWRDITAPEYVAESERQMARFGETGRIGPYEKEYLRRDGSRFWMVFAGASLGDGTIAEYCIDITDRKRAEAALRESEGRLAREVAGARTLQQVSSELMSDAEPRTLYRKLVDAAIALMRADAGSFQRLERDGSLRLLASRHFDPESERHWQWVGVDSASTCGVALDRNERIVVSDVETCDFMAGTPDLDAYRQSRLRAVQSTPLVARDGRAVGMLSTHWHETHEPSANELALFDVLAREAADLLDRAQAQTALRERGDWLKGQGDALMAAVNGAPLETSLGVLVRTASAALGDGVRAAFYLADASGTTLHHVVGMSPAYAEAVNGFAIGADSLACGLAAHCGEPVLTVDVQTDPRWEAWRSMAERFQYRGCWSFPVQSATGTLVGTFAVYWPQPRDASARELELASLLTNTAAIIISRHRESEVRERAERALRDSEERFRMLADNMSQLAWICDAVGSVTWYNQRWLDYTGLTFDDMKGWDWSRVHPDHLGRVVAAVRRSVETGEPWDDTFPLRGKDGDYRWFLSRAIPIRNEQGDIARWFGTSTDITEQRGAEEALKEADRRKDEFLSMASHELRNPLNALQLQLVALVRATEATDEPIQQEWASERLGQAVAATRRLVHLVETLLDVSRITAGRLNLEPEEMDVAASVRAIVDRLTDQQDGQIVVQAVPVHGTWDKLRLEQVITNLVSNALKYGEGLPIEISLEADDGSARLSVTDHGIGIKPEDQQRLFERFERAVARRKYGGFGLGLWITRHLVVAMGGQISVESRPGDGSTFRVTVPRRRTNIAETSQAASAGGSPYERPANWADPRRRRRRAFTPGADECAGGPGLSGDGV